MKKILVALVVVILVYVASPYAALVLLVRAATQGDEDSLASRVDFETLRTSLSEQIEARTVPAGETVEPGQRVMLQTAIHGFASPRGIALLLKSGGRMPLGESSAPGSDSQGFDLSDLDWLFFTSPTRFEVQRRGGALIFEPRGIGWRLVDVKLPPLGPGEAPPTPRVAPPPVTEAPQLEEPDFGIPPASGS